MPTLTLSEIGQASRNAILATKVSKALHTLASGGALKAAELGVLHRGASLVGEIVQGALVVRGSDAVQGLAPSVTGLGAFSRAVYAAEQAGMSSVDEDMTSVFLRLRDRMQSLASGAAAAPAELNVLQRFFGAIALTFQRDLQAATVSHTDPFPSGT